MWATQKRIELAYERALRAIFERVARMEGTGLSVADMLKKMSTSQYFRGLAEVAASRMVSLTMAQNARSWREAAREGSRGEMIHRALQRELSGRTGERVRGIINQNAELISNVPLQLAQRITKKIAEQAFHGRRAIAFEKQLPRMAAARLRLIARTETSKASTALTQARSEDMGLKWYVWRSSKDKRVRPSHVFMARDGGVIIPWNDPPSPEALIHEKSTLGDYHAGDCPNCRCYAEPLMRMDQVHWPHRVYWQGQVRIMTRATFATIAGHEVRI